MKVCLSLIDGISENRHRLIDSRGSFKGADIWKSLPDQGIG